MLLLRKITFYILFAAYVLILPGILFYALGYEFKPGAMTVERLARTGVISLQSVPKNAAIWVGGSRFRDKTPTFLPDLTPGTYPVRVELKGHEPWTGSIPVEAGKATVAEKILLLPKDLKARRIAEGPFRNLKAVPRTAYFLAAKGNYAGDLYVVAWQTGRLWPLVDHNDPLSRAQLIRWYTVPESPLAVVCLKVGSRIRLYKTHLSQSVVEMVEIPNLFDTVPDRVEWNPRSPSRIYYQAGNKLVLYDAAVRRSTLIDQKTSGFTLGQDRVWVLSQNKISLKNPIAGTSEEIHSVPQGKTAKADRELLSAVHEPRPSNFVPANASAPLYHGQSSRDNISFLSPDDEWILWSRNRRIAIEGVAGVDVTDLKTRALVWTHRSIGWMALSDQDPPAIPRLAGKAGWLYQNGRDIRQAEWVYRGHFVLYRDNDKIQLLEVFPHGDRRVRQLARSRSDSDFVHPHRSGPLFYIDPDNGSILQLDFIPEEGLLELLTPLQSANLGNF